MIWGELPKICSLCFAFETALGVDRRAVISQKETQIPERLNTPNVQNNLRPQNICFQFVESYQHQASESRSSRDFLVSRGVISPFVLENQARKMNPLENINQCLPLKLGQKQNPETGLFGFFWIWGLLLISAEGPSGKGHLKETRS